MSYLLDTCTISTLRKKKTEESLKLRIWMDSHDDQLYFVSALTIGELQFGIDNLSLKDESVKNILQSWLVGDLIPSFGDRIISLDQHICTLWGKISAQAQRQGVILPMGDALLAATAIRHDLIVVTQNVKHFRPTGVRFLNPLE